LQWGDVPQIHDIVCPPTQTRPEVTTSCSSSSSNVNVTTSLTSIDAGALAATTEKREKKDESDSGSGEQELEKLIATRSLMFEVVHYKGTQYRSSRRWAAKVPKGYVPKGACGMVFELRDNFIKPSLESDWTQPSPYWLPVGGKSSGVKILHLQHKDLLKKTDPSPPASSNDLGSVNRGKLPAPPSWKESQKKDEAPLAMVLQSLPWVGKEEAGKLLKEGHSAEEAIEVLISKQHQPTATAIKKDDEVMATSAASPPTPPAESLVVSTQPSGKSKKVNAAATVLPRSEDAAVVVGAHKGVASFRKRNAAATTGDFLEGAEERYDSSVTVTATATATTVSAPSTLAGAAGQGAKSLFVSAKNEKSKRHQQKQMKTRAKTGKGKAGANGAPSNAPAPLAAAVGGAWEHGFSSNNGSIGFGGGGGDDWKDGAENSKALDNTIEGGGTRRTTSSVRKYTPLLRASVQPPARPHPKFPALRLNLMVRSRTQRASTLRKFCGLSGRWWTRNWPST
jgi:hypothetical protein